MQGGAEGPGDGVGGVEAVAAEQAVEEGAGFVEGDLGFGGAGSISLAGAGAGVFCALVGDREVPAVVFGPDVGGVDGGGAELGLKPGGEGVAFEVVDVAGAGFGGVGEGVGCEGEVEEGHDRGSGFGGGEARSGLVKVAAIAIRDPFDGVGDAGFQAWRRRAIACWWMI